MRGWHIDQYIMDLFDPRNTSPRHTEEAIKIYERNAKCEKCGEKAIKVIDFCDYKTTCTKCGHELRVEVIDLSKITSLI